MLLLLLSLITIGLATPSCNSIGSSGSWTLEYCEASDGLELTLTAPVSTGWMAFAFPETAGRMEPSEGFIADTTSLTLSQVNIPSGTKNNGIASQVGAAVTDATCEVVNGDFSCTWNVPSSDARFSADSNVIYAYYSGSVSGYPEHTREGSVNSVDFTDFSGSSSSAPKQELF